MQHTLASRTVMIFFSSSVFTYKILGIKIKRSIVIGSAFISPNVFADRNEKCKPFDY